MNPDASTEAKARASHFLTLVTQNRPVWGLRNEGGGLATWRFEDSQERLIPFWSEEEKAQLCGEANFPDYKPFELSAKYFTESVLPQLQKEGILVGVNLSDQMGGIDLPAADLIAEIQAAGK
ncbi:MAG: DUF2750 domain-containing protein [Planctomycetota bacterium]|jgi:hypothetical protein